MDQSDVVILGVGKSGKAAASYFQELGIAVKTHDGPSGSLGHAKMLVCSPGIPLDHPMRLEAESRGIEVVGEVELAFRELQGSCLIGVTGSNGKTTTTLFLAHALNQSGRRALACGNLGIPLLDTLKTPCDIRVVELSSHQLETTSTKALTHGLILNITPNHLDRYQTLERYRSTKWRIAELIRGSLFVGRRSLPACEGALRFDSERIESLWEKEYKLWWQSVAFHDRENILAASALLETFGLTREEVRASWETFRKPPHRLEMAWQHQGVIFVNDSKSTSVDATVQALLASPSKVHLIAGGVDKGGDYKKWAVPLQRRGGVVYALGEAQERICEQLGSLVPLVRVDSLREAVVKASKLAQAGEWVLLSPGCSSFDQFANFEERGEQFRRVAREVCMGGS